MRLFYSVLLWATRLEIALAKAQPQRNHRHLASLHRDEADYERAILRIDLGMMR